jgi:hypothetical protein
MAWPWLLHSILRGQSERATCSWRASSPSMTPTRCLTSSPISSYTRLRPRRHLRLYRSFRSPAALEVGAARSCCSPEQCCCCLVWCWLCDARGWIGESPRRKAPGAS